MTEETPRTEPGSDLPMPDAEDLAGAAAAAAAPGATSDTSGGMAGDVNGSSPEGAEPATAEDPLVAALALADARLAELQRERADFVNFRRRTERDREVSVREGKLAVLGALLPVLDDIDGARTHGDLTGPFAAVAEKLDSALQRIGLEPLGTEGEPFDPALHEALLHEQSDAVEVDTCTRILQRGFRFDDRVLRPARVLVTSPE